MFFVWLQLKIQNYTRKNAYQCMTQITTGALIRRWLYTYMHIYINCMQSKTVVCLQDIRNKVFNNKIIALIAVIKEA